MIGLLLLANGVLMSGNDLYASCAPVPNAICTAFAAAVSDELTVLEQARLTPRAYCPRDGVTGRQVEDVIRRFLIDHPETRDRAAALLATGALMDAFPCPK